MNRENCPYSGHQSLMSGIRTKNTVHVLDINFWWPDYGQLSLPMFRTLTWPYSGHRGRAGYGFWSCYSSTTSMDHIDDRFFQAIILRPILLLRFASTPKAKKKKFCGSSNPTDPTKISLNCRPNTFFYILTVNNSRLVYFLPVSSSYNDPFTLCARVFVFQGRRSGCGRCEPFLPHHIFHT